MARDGREPPCWTGSRSGIPLALVWGGSSAPAPVTPCCRDHGSFPAGELTPAHLLPQIKSYFSLVLEALVTCPLKFGGAAA